MRCVVGFAPMVKLACGLVEGGMKTTIDTWAASRLWQAIDIDCTTAVMLKILDGKCKMGREEKMVMTLLYDCVKDRGGQLLGDEAHRLISRARERLAGEEEGAKESGAGEADSEAAEGMRMQVYEMRMLAETMISRPVMKAFKAMLRDEGVIGSAGRGTLPQV